jgi:hypothetical protein
MPGLMDVLDLGPCAVEPHLNDGGERIGGVNYAENTDKQHTQRDNMVTWIHEEGLLLRRGM